MAFDCRDSWRSFSSFRFCTIHRVSFALSDPCPHPFISHGNVNVKNVVSSDFTSNSQAITSNSQGVNIPSPSNSFHVKRSYKKKVKDSVFERFHNFGVKFVAVVDWDALFKYDEVKLNNNVSYKRLDFDLGLVRVFRKSILITLRSSQEVKGMLFRDAERISKDKVAQIIQLLPKSIKLLDSEVVNTHNAFVNHPTAKYDVNVSVNGEARLISDNSKGHPELEAVNPKFVKSDSEILEKFNEDLISNNPDPLSVQSNRIKFIEDSLVNFSVNMNRHVSVMEKIEEGIVNLNSSLSLRARSEDSLTSPLKFSSSLPTCSRDDNLDDIKKRKLRLDFAKKHSGFGRSVWGDE